MSIAIGNNEEIRRIFDDYIQSSMARIGPIDNNTSSSFQLTSKEDGDVTSKLRRIRDRYKNSFTVHGVNHIIDGTVPEKVLWTIKLAIVLFVAVYLCWNFFVAFSNYEVDTNMKIVLKDPMKFPTIMICNNLVDILRIFESLNDCSSNTSGSYDTNICNEINRQCPTFYENDGPSDVVSCDKTLMGRCVALNANGTIMQTSRGKVMILMMTFNASMLPLVLFVSTNGVTPLVDVGKLKFVTQFGYHHYSLEKTTYQRKGKPYSNPHYCIEEGSEEALTKNIFTGPYTVLNCKHTCRAKEDLKVCGVVQNHYRAMWRNKEMLQNKLTKNFTKGKECFDSFHARSDEYNECARHCHLPCTEERYHVQGDSIPSNMIDTADVTSTMILLRFEYKSLEETQIIEEASLDGKILLSSFGGTLGLMCGMSALSLIEVIYYFTLMMIGQIHRLYNLIIFRRHKQNSMV